MSENKTKSLTYAKRLEDLPNIWWKRIINVQAPYKWNIVRLNLGKVLEVGCGAGRLLEVLGPESVGVDHNNHVVKIARQKGLYAYTSTQFLKNEKLYNQKFDSLLCAHVLEHLSPVQADKLLKDYLKFIKDKVVIICPQKKGFLSDPTHITYFQIKDIVELLQKHGLVIDKAYSFPLPSFFGKYFTYNENIVIAHKKA